jgi:ABC-type amino acid transport system permease subunit
MNDPDWTLERAIWALIFIAVPAALGFLAALSTGGSWRLVLGAFVVLALLCFLLGVHGEQAWDKRFLAAIIYWMISCIPGIPIMVLVMRLFGLR